jgi:2-polyprenyl-3-methyl-5-hydroxy-6-metoxy-1,4-benzoquinol methylase
MALTRRLIELAGIGRSEILDVGCGLGATVNFLLQEGFDAIGVDKSENLIRQGRAMYGNLPIFAWRSLPKDRLYDAVLLECVLSAQIFADEQRQLLDECAMALKPAGAIMISDIYDLNESHDHMTKHFWLSLLQDAGFKKLLFEDHTRELRDFAAQLIWRAGSRDDVRGCLGCKIPDKSGYFALIAKQGQDLGALPQTPQGGSPP